MSDGDERSQLTRRHAAGTATGADQYRLAQLLAADGNPAAALDVLDAAETTFRAAGQHLGAARCDAGRFNVLDDLGRHADALAAIGRWVGWLEGPEAATAQSIDELERRRLLAQAQANLGVHAERAGDYLGALEAHDAAIAGAHDEPATAAVMQVNRANALNLLGRSPEAYAALAAAARVLEDEGGAADPEALAMVAINTGESLCRMGRPDDGLAWFAKAEDLVEPGSVHEAALLVETADALSALGALDEAARRYAEALVLLDSLPLVWLETRAWTGAGAAAASLDRPAEAAAAFDRAAEGHLAAGNVPGWAVNEADAISVSGAGTPGRHGRIAALREAVAAEGADDQWPVQAVHVHLRLADVVDGADAAERHLLRATELARSVGVPHLVVAAAVRLGRFLARHDRLDEAAAIIGPAVEVADGIRRRLHGDDLLRSFPTTVADGYDVLVRIRIARGQIADALELSDAARSRAVAEGGVAPTAVTTDAAEDELNGIYDRLLSLDGSTSTELRRSLDARARRLEERLGRFELDAERAPRRHGRAALAPVDDGEVQAIYQVVDGVVGVFVRTSTGVTFHRDLAPLATVADELEAFRSIGRRSLAVARITPERLDSMVASADDRLARLGQLLLAPLRDALGGGAVHRLVVIPHAALHSIPFHALRLDGVTLIDAVPTSMALSLSVRQSRPDPRLDGPTVLVGRSSPELPGVGAELDAIAASVAKPVVLRDDAATIEAVTSAMDGAACVHLATHGIFRPNAPLRSGVRLSDGWLTARHTAGLDLRGATVVLSACDTGRTIVHAGDELVGLQRGFFLAGASSVVMSLWPAVDDVATTCMVALHQARANGADVTSALAAGYVAARRQTSHPWWWAPFIVSGR